MSTSKDFANIYKVYLKQINHYKKVIKSIESMRHKVEKKQIIATKEEVELVEKEELTDEDIYSCEKDKIYNFSNGDKYIGQIQENELDGKGHYIMYEDDEIILEYTGEFENNLRQGIGQCKFQNGNIYIGKFKDDLMDDIGNMTYPSGEEYTGEWKNGKKHGIGLFIWSDNVRYNGEFKEGKRDGQGECLDKNGNLIYEGQWKNNLIHGYGTYIWNEGKRYEGEFMHGKKHGNGTFYLNGELVYEGTWKYDKPSIFGRSLDELFSVKF